MKKLKKRKLALATAIATLGACFSMFSGMSASAEWQSAEMVVIDVTDSTVLIAYARLSAVSSRDMLCSFYTLGKQSPAVAPIAEQVEYGDVLRYSGEGYISSTCTPLINAMGFDGDDEGEVEIIGSVFDASFGNFGSVAVDDQTSVQITGADGTRYVFENGSDYKEVEAFLGWEYGACYTGFSSYSDTTEYSEELANKYSKESGRPIWVLPNEDSDVNSVEWRGDEFVVIYNDPANMDILVAAPEYPFVGDDMTCRFHIMGTNSPEFAQIAEQLKYGDVIRHSDQSLLRVNPIEGISNIAYDSDDGIVEIVGSVFDTPIGDFDAVTIGDETLMQVTCRDGTKYVFENEVTYDDVNEFIWRRSTDEYHKEEHAIWMLPNEDSDVTSAEWNNDELFVISTLSDKGSVLVVYPQKLFEPEGNSDYLMDELKFHFYVMDMPTTKQLKYGDVLRYSDEVGVYYSEVCGVNVLELLHADTLQGDDASRNAVEVVGSVFDTPSEHFGFVTIDGQTFIQIIDRDGTKYVFEDGISYTDLDEFALRNSNEEYYKESGRPIWIRPNEDGDVNSDNQVNSADAAVILEDIALSAVGDTGRMNASENQAADVNGDGVIDAQDAAIVLSYSAETGSGMLEGVTLKAYAGR